MAILRYRTSTKQTPGAGEREQPPALVRSALMRTPRIHLSLLLILVFYYSPSSAVDFLFNGFEPSDLNLYGDATLKPGPGRRYLSLTNASAFSLGRALYKSKVPAKSSASAGGVLRFSASFLFSIARIPGVLPGHGFAFLFAPAAGTLGATSSQHLGLFNMTTDGDPASRVLAVEFDVFENQEFNDINNNHVGVDVNSLTSVAASPAGYWPDDPSSPFVNLTLNDGSNYQAWVDYSGGRLNVTMAPATLGRKPRRPLISIVLDLSAVFLNEMFVGFCAATGMLVEHHRILGWSFSNSNFSAADGLITSDLPNFKPSQSSSKSKALVAGIPIAAAVLLVSAAAAGLLVVLRRRHRRKNRMIEENGRGGHDAMEDWELEYWPHRIGYREILAATEGFSDKNLIGYGGSGRVYKGILAGAEVAVKLFSQSGTDETRQFAAEVSSLGRLKHRNLVGLRGWCRTRRDQTAGGGSGGEIMILVYDYMENGSLDKWIHDASEPLVWRSRVRILKDVAAAVLYLHEGWGEARVIHRDIKLSNVMLDRWMAGRLGDFGLARAHPHGRAQGTTRVVGTAGYLAPELFRSGRATAATDVYAYGVLALEVVSGRRPAEEGRPPLVGWARGVAAAAAVVDPRVRGVLGFEFDEAEAERVVALALACTVIDPAARPTMRQVVRALEAGDEKVDGEDGESADAWLLDARLRWGSGMGWADPKIWRPAGTDRHLTFEQLRQSLSCSMSLSDSDIITEGR